MNIIDIVLVILIVSAAINGLTKGFFIELASIASLILGIWAAIEFSGFVQYWLSKQVSWGATSTRLVAFILIFVFVVIVVHLVANLTEKFVEAIALGILSRLAGMILGALKAAFILSVLMIIIDKIEFLTVTIIPENIKAESKLYPRIKNMAPTIFPFLKEQIEQIPLQPKKNVII